MKLDNKLINYYSTAEKRPVTADFKQNFAQLGVALNLANKNIYELNSQKRTSQTNTICNAKSDLTPQFENCKIVRKAYRANSECKTIYEEKKLAKHSLINFDSTPYDVISSRDQSK